jgi:predicted Zn-dependent protease with MMP-like domain
MLEISRRRFESLVSRALDRLPPEFQDHLENVSVVIEEEPDAELLEAMGFDLNDADDTLFGVYHGIPLTERRFDEVLLPDQITIFRRPLLEWAESEEEIVEEVRVTVLHEIGHFFGLDEDRLEDLGYA